MSDLFVFGDKDRECFERGDIREGAVGRDETIDTAAVAAAEGGGKMKGIESTETMVLGVASQQQLGASVVFLQESLNDEPLRFRAVGDIVQKLAGVVHGHGACSHLNGRNRGEFYQSQPRCENPVSPLGKNAGNGSRSLLGVEQFGERAGVEKIQHASVVSALLNDQVGEGARNILPSLLDFRDGSRDATPFGTVGMALGEVLVIESVIERFDGEDDSFPIVERYGLDWADNSLVKNGFHANGHGFSLSDFLEEVCSI